MVLPSRMEIKEKIYVFLRERVGTIDRHQTTQDLQYHSIETLANEYGLSQEETRKLSELFLEVFNEIYLLGMVARRREEQFFFITERGKKFLLDQTFDIFDPDMYLNNLPRLDPITFSYIKESIHAFNYNLFISSIMTLGVASESLILDLAKLLESKSGDITLKKYLESTTSNINKIIDRIDKICTQKNIPSYPHYKSAIYSIAHFIRHFRNQYNHPNMATANFEDAHALLTLFKTYSKMIVEFKGII